MKILYGNTDVTQYVLSYRKRADYIEGYIIGQVPIYEIELSLNNKHSVFSTISSDFTVYEGEEKTGVFEVYEAPEKNGNTVRVVLYDNMHKLTRAYDSILDYEKGVTVQVQLDEISSITGLRIVYSSLPDHVLNKVITFYDNTLTMLDCVGWIAELAGRNVEADSDGNIIFKIIDIDSPVEIESVSDYEIDGSHSVSRVLFDNGEVVFEKGSAENGTLYLNPNNPYIDSQAIVDYIYELYNGLSLDCFTSIRMKGIRSLQLGDIAEYDGHKFIVTSLLADEYGGDSYPIYELVGYISDKSVYEYARDVSPSIKYKILEADLGSFKVLTTNEFKAIRGEVQSLNVSSLTARVATIEEAYISRSEVNELWAKIITTENLNANVANLGYLKSVEAELKYATIEALNTETARINNLVSISITTDNLEAKVGELGYLKSADAELKYATIENLNAEKGRIDTLYSTTIKTDELEAKVATFDYLKANELEAKVGEFGYLKANDLEAEVGKFGYLKASNLESEVGKFGYLTAERAALEYAKVEDLNAATGRITNLESETIKTSQLSAMVAELGYATVNNLKAVEADVESLEAKDAEIEKLIAGKVSADELYSKVAAFGYLKATDAEIKYATIDSLSSSDARIEKLETSVATIDKAYVDEAKVRTLLADEGYITNVTVNSLLSNYATIDLANVKDGSITNAMIGTGVVQTANIADGSITDAKIVGLTASKITAGTLDAGTIDVINLNAANITVGTINGQQISPGAIDMSKLSPELNESLEENKVNVNQALADAGFALDTVTDLENRANNGEFKGEDGTVLRIDSSRGTVFKNNEVSTVLSAVIFRGSKRITDITVLHEEFGPSAYLEWYWQRMGESTFGTILSTDTRLGNDGFTFTLSPDDVDSKVVFMCQLITD